MNLFSLSGKTALVTGCNRGIGKSIAKGLASAGADIIGVSATLPLRESSIAKEVEGLGKKFSAFNADFGDRESVYKCIKAVRENHPVIDILINNAGTILRSPAEIHADAYWDKVIDINLNSQFILTREIGRDMLARGGGKIVFTCSLLSFQGGINVPGYTASKSAIAGLVKAFSNEWAGRGVHVNGIAPGYIETDNTEALRADPVRRKSILERIPANRWGKPEDFIGPAIFLSSDAADYVHGTILTVDGGWMGR